MTQRTWTVARCNRLLRPFITKLQKLRLLKDEKNCRPMPAIRSKKSRKPAVSDSSDSDSDKTGRSKTTKDYDPDWMSIKKKKKGNKAYSARNNSQRNPAAEIGVRTPAKKVHSNLRPGELSIPTPYLTRNTSETLDASGSSSPTHGNGNGKAPSRAASGSGFADVPKKMKLFMADSEDEQAVTVNAMRLYIEILHATAESPDPNEQKTSSPSRGARSLWAMCCSKFGGAIAEVEADPDPEEDGLLDMGTVYYGMAEDLELPVRAGGQLHLRLIVRAHATSIMAAAVKEGLVDAKVLRKYLHHLVQPIEHSGHPPSPQEAELLMSLAHALVSPWTDDLTCCGRGHFNHFFMAITDSVMGLTPAMSDARRFGFICRQFTHLLSHRDFPVEWIAARRMTPLWKDMLRTILDSKSVNDVQDAFELLRQTVSHALGLRRTAQSQERVLAGHPADFVTKSEICPRCPRPQLATFLVNYSSAQQGTVNEPKWNNVQLSDALSNTLSSMSTMFSSFCIASHYTPEMLSNVNARTMIFGLNFLAIDILQHHAKRLPPPSSIKLPKTKARRTISVLIAIILPQLAGCQLPAGLAFAPVNDIVRLMKRLDAEMRINASDSNTILDCLPEIVCSIARGVAQLSKADSFDILRDFVFSLASARADGQNLSQPSMLFLKQLAFSSAHYFAVSSEDSSHYSLIAEIEKEVGQLEHFDMSKTPFRSSTKARSGSRAFTWEEGICEWVLASPKHNPAPKYVEKPKMSKFRPLVPPIEDDEEQDEDQHQEHDKEDLPSTPATEIDEGSLNYLCNLIQGSSPEISPRTWDRSSKSKLAPEEEESYRVQDIGVAQMEVPLPAHSLFRLKRPYPVDSESSDDELSFNGPKSRKRPSSPKLRTSSSFPSQHKASQYKASDKVPKNAEVDESEDELSLA
ncbi:hypothetical protein FKW77_001452 [Venturia effusa]|uniref:Uncharacterized protein n=1 Tax=Venturia effusa TaxID=50376 RepID=A0A517LD71_9PEZI|nr:hypothetical protein FKW77_001452 [Venturia effusa]